MRTSFVVAVLLVGLAVAGGTAAGQPGTPLEGDGATFAAVEEGNNSSVSNESVGFGSSVSSFLQSTAAETNTAVDQGIWEASVEGNATVEEAQHRAVRLGERVAELRAQRARLAELRSNGSISLPTYVARDARLRAELRSLGAAANQTQQVAPNATAVQQSLASVEQAADAASGPPAEVANRTGVPSDVPGVGNGTENGSEPGETPANASNGEGPPSDVGDTRSNEAGNSSDGAGNGDTGAGNGADGSGNGTNGSGTAGNGTDSTGSAGADDSGSSSSNSAGSNGNGSNGPNTGTADNSSSGTNGGAAGSAAGSDGGTGDSDDSGTKSQSNAPGNPGPKSD